MSLSTNRMPLDRLALSTMLLLTLLWGAQQVTIKLAASDISLVMQAGLRSIVAALLLLIWARLRGIRLISRNRMLAKGLITGMLFAAEFAFIYAGLAHTTVSRLVVFLYLAPCLTALGLTFFVPGERLLLRQWCGILLAFSGIATAFGEGFFETRGATWVGDFFGLVAASLWAATTVIIRATPLANVSATEVLFYQLAVSALILPVVSWALGEPGILRFTLETIIILFYQGAVVAFASYLVWFWLLRKYLAAQLSVLSFFTPLFGVVFGVLILGDSITGFFALAVVFVCSGIVLVTLPSGGTAPQELTSRD